MSLDTPTLLIVSICIAAMLGLFLCFAWIQDRNIRALGWWGAAYLLGGFAVALWMLDSLVSPPLPYGFANALLFVACGMVWNGARLFHGRRVLPLALFAGGAVWLTASQFSAFTQSASSRVVLSFIIVSIYTFSTARALWRDRRGPSRRAAIFVPLLHGMVFLPPIPLAFMPPAGQGASLFSGGWTAVFTLEILLYAVGTAFIVLTMAKERTENVHKAAAVTDGLTGLLNRRGFLDRAQTLMSRKSSASGSITVLMFDLDHFKSINDRFGHATGDEALRIFAATLKANLRASDIIGRLGGEEFAAVLPSPLGETRVVAERIRAAFEAAGMEVAGHRLGATVSIGGTCAATPGYDMEALLARADTALYSAKANGRNRLVATEDEDGPAGSIDDSELPQSAEVAFLVPVAPDYGATQLAPNAAV
jgi:diguanylate cyclase (GGDEF)-like protein